MQREHEKKLLPAGSMDRQTRKHVFDFAPGFFKIRKITWIHFIFVSLIIILLPVIREWRTLMYGVRVEGEVVEYTYFNAAGELDYNGQTVRSEIEFLYSGKLYTLYGPENIKYKLGKKMPVILSKKKPGEFIIPTFSGFYLQKRSVSLIIVLTIWLAIYATLVQYQKGTLIQRKRRV